MITWQPSASIATLKKRAELIALIRDFFAKRNILEVETPILSHHTVTDPYVQGISVLHQDQLLFLQTSPEYAMKRLLAAGAESIYQMTKSFRYGDRGRLHNPEFTMLEWYRVGFDHQQLMNEMDELLQCILKTAAAHRITCTEIYEKFVGINPHTATMDELTNCVKEKIFMKGDIQDRNTALELLFTHCIEPFIAKDRPLFLYDFPVSQASLAIIREDQKVASRFEVYFKGMELANGFHELLNVEEQHNRFLKDLSFREKNNLPLVEIDERFLAALSHGMPNCAGVALGIDRLIMLALEKNSISDVMSFDFERA